MRLCFRCLVVAMVALWGCTEATTTTDHPIASTPLTQTPVKAVAVKRTLRAFTVAPPIAPTNSLREIADDLTSKFAAQEPADELLIGLDERGADDLFGMPQRRHENATNKTWYYRDETCALELYFYVDMSSHVFRTLAYEVSSDDQSAESRDHCIARLRSAKRSAGSSDRGDRR